MSDFDPYDGRPSIYKGPGDWFPRGPLKTAGNLAGLQFAGQHQPLRPTGTEAAVCADIAARQRLGIAKYGTTVAQNPLELRAWLEHQYQELLDAAIYCKRAIQEIDRNQSDGK